MSLFHDGPVSPVSSWPFQEINLDDSNGPLSAILAQKVVNIYIVFTESQDIKPHAEFQLETEAYTAIGGWQTVRGTPIPTKSINLGMNPHLLPATNFKSSITVSTPYLHREHIVSFKFLTADMNSTLKDYLSVLRGNYQKIPPVTEDGKLTPEQEEIVSKDLARFYNGPPWQTGSQVPATTMGSRDFVTQSMIRWEENKMVPWNAVTALGYRRPKPSLPTHFFDFITKPLRIETAPPRSDEDPGLPRRKRVKRIVCSDGPEIPMDRGVFGARVTRSCGKSILYAPDTSSNTPSLSTTQASLLARPQGTHQTNPPSQVAYSPARPLPLAPPLSTVYTFQAYEAHQGSQGQQGSHEQDGIQPPTTYEWQLPYTGPE